MERVTPTSDTGTSKELVSPQSQPSNQMDFDRLMALRRDEKWPSSQQSLNPTKADYENVSGLTVGCRAYHPEFFKVNPHTPHIPDAQSFHAILIWDNKRKYIKQAISPSITTAQPVYSPDPLAYTDTFSAPAHPFGLNESRPLKYRTFWRVIRAVKGQPYISVQEVKRLTQSLSSLQQYPLLAKLKMLQNTPEADRFPGADWPTDQAFEEAASFVTLLPLPDILAPKIYIAHDGEINFLWKRDDGLHIDLGFYGDGTYSYYAIDKSGRESMGDDVAVSQGLPHVLTEMLTA